MGSDLVKDLDERQLVEQVGRPEFNPVEEMLDPPQVRGAQAADDADDDLVPLLEQEFSDRSSDSISPIVSSATAGAGASGV